MVELRLPAHHQPDAFHQDLLGQYSDNPLAVDIFAVNLLLASLATQATLQFGRRAGLLIARSDVREVRAERARVAASTLVIGPAWVNTGLAKYCWLLLALIPLAADRWSWHRDRRSGPGAGSPGETGTS